MNTVKRTDCEAQICSGTQTHSRRGVTDADRPRTLTVTLRFSCAHHAALCAIPKLASRSGQKNERREGDEQYRHRGNGDCPPRKMVAPTREAAVGVLSRQSNVMHAYSHQRDCCGPPCHSIGGPLERPNLACPPAHHEVHEPDYEGRDDWPPAWLLHRFHEPTHGSKRGSSRPAMLSIAA